MNLSEKQKQIIVEMRMGGVIDKVRRQYYLKSNYADISRAFKDLLKLGLTTNKGELTDLGKRIEL